MTREERIELVTDIVKALPDVWLMRSPIVSTAEAMAFCRVNSKRSWRDFCARTGLRRVSENRYDRQQVERAARYDTKTRRD